MNRLAALTLGQIVDRLTGPRARARATRLSLVLVVLAAIAFVSVGATSAEPAPRRLGAITTNLVAYWKLEEASGTRLDETTSCGGGGCDLTDNNTVTQAAGKLGNAAQFTAANGEYLSRADEADLSTGDIDFTITAWVWLDSKTSRRPFISKFSAAGQREIDFGYNNSTDRFYFFVTYDGTNGNSATADNFGSPSTGAWYFLVGWHDSVANQLGISVSGIENNVAYSFGGFDSSSALVIGADPVQARYFDGRIDSVGFWKRVLTADERTCLYNSGSGVEYPFTACDPTATPTNTNTFTPTVTPTFTLTPTITNTFTATPTITATFTDTPTITATFTDTGTPTPTDTGTPTYTPTPTPTDTATLTPTPDGTSTPTPTPAPCPTEWVGDARCFIYSTGNTLIVERRATMGDAVILGAQVVIIAAIIVAFLIWLAREVV